MDQMTKPSGEDQIAPSSHGHRHPGLPIFHDHSVDGLKAQPKAAELSLCGHIYPSLIHFWGQNAGAMCNHQKLHNYYHKPSKIFVRYIRPSYKKICS